MVYPRGTLCVLVVAWRLRTREGYRLSKPIKVKVTDLLYIDDLTVFAASESKLNRVLKETVYRSGAGYRPLLESEKVLSGTREEKKKTKSGKQSYSVSDGKIGA